MAIDKIKRKKMENLIYNVFNTLDPSGTNTTKYKEMFSNMNDTQFDNFFKNLFNNDNEYLILDIVDYERDFTLDNVEKAADILGVPLYEKLALPFVNENKEEPVITKYPVPVGYAHLKRMQQMLSKKNALSTNISSRSALTGQVTAADKNARDSDSENFCLVTLGANEILRELNG